MADELTRYQPFEEDDHPRQGRGHGRTSGRFAAKPTGTHAQGLRRQDAYEQSQPATQPASAKAPSSTRPAAKPTAESAEPPAGKSKPPVSPVRKTRRRTTPRSRTGKPATRLTPAQAKRAFHRLKRGDSGEEVNALQQMLQRLGFAVSPTGFYGPATTAAVREAQRTLGLRDTGRAGTSLLRRLDDAMKLSPCVQRAAEQDPAGDYLARALDTSTAKPIVRPAHREVAVNVSDTAWSDFDESDYTPQQWYDACVVHLGDEDNRYVKANCKLPVREPDGTLNRNGVHAAAGRLSSVQGLSASGRRAAARRLLALYDDLGEEAPDSLSAVARASYSDEYEIARYERSWPLDDIVVRSGGDGRTVEAYAAIFDHQYEVRDQHGHYMETIERAAFNKTLADDRDLRRVQCLYNHGMSLRGQPMALACVPLGRPLEVRPDSKGLLTITRYNDSELADAVLASIRNGDITSQSFRGRLVRSTPPRGPYHSHPGRMLTVTRHELGLSDYGPTPLAVNSVPMMLAVRSATDVAADIDRLDPEQRTELITILSRSAEPEPATPDQEGAGTEEPLSEHSGRLTLTRNRVLSDAVIEGVL